ncbi:hypothetical protein H310_03103 [Aphanomyces invadans]|nr:hypothetical protein H310_03103 [Aphanomyces invadans]ETW07005.1 hypothetical protein H310_03103 [Aphanomyces invadans]|eukprot:XP_008865080.1 hypothetical protein H310_03103 [Aphanomyces invadans]
MLHPSSALVCALAIATTTQASLAPCDSSKIALAVVPTYDTPDATACATATLSGRPFNSLFETTPASTDTIKAMAANPRCQAWFSNVASIFVGMSACSFLGRNIQEYGKLTLTEFLEANNKEIQSFDPSRTEPPTTDGPSTTLAPNNVVDASTAPQTTTAPTTSKPSSAASIVLTAAAAAVSSALFFA